MSRFLVSALGAAILLSIAAMAIAGQPDPGTSSGENRIGVSPKNLTAPPAAVYTYVYNLLDSSGTPVVGFPASQVELDFTACANPSTRPQNQIPADGDSDANGDVFWSVNLAFGGSDPCQVDVLVQNQVFFNIPPDPGGGVRSPDVNGDGSVAVNDLALWQQTFTGPQTPYIGDLAEPFDDQVAVNDLAVYQQHFVAP
jgi:hypothetical protein